jgi:hypothetical protein
MCSGSFACISLGEALRQSMKASYRLPFVRKWLTLYSDSFAHDDVSPISAPRRAAIRPGIYLSHVPSLPHLDFRVEAASTDPPTSRSNGGQFIYTEEVQKEGYTNKGYIIGDPIGRESKGGQAWLTYHLSPREDVQFLSQRESSERLIPGGTTQNSFQFSAVKRSHDRSPEFIAYTLAAMTIKAAADTDIFLIYLDHFLCPKLKPGNPANPDPMTGDIDDKIPRLDRAALPAV